MKNFAIIFYICSQYLFYKDLYLNSAVTIILHG